MDAMPQTQAMAQPALAGIKVIDLTQFEAGTSITETLAWLGAEVIKVENPVGGEQGRSASSDRKDADSYYFMVLNANKKSVTLNLKSERGKKLLRDLIRKADIFAENFAPGVIERLGFSYDEVAALNPSIIYATVKGFGNGSRYEKHLAFDMIAQACGGVMSITGETAGRPIKPGVTLGDTGTGLHACIGVLAALYQRTVTGRGQKVQVAMQDAMVNYCRIAYASQLLHGRACPRMDNQVVLGALMRPPTSSNASRADITTTCTSTRAAPTTSSGSASSRSSDTRISRMTRAMRRRSFVFRCLTRSTRPSRPGRSITPSTRQC
jgi:formyl-CoA transferase